MTPLNRIRARATYANVTATLALFVALGGGSFAVAALSGQEKKVVKKIAKNQAGKRITARAPDLSVKHADTATSASHASTADQLTCTPPVAGTGEMVKAGAVCIDKYEASVWTAADGGTQLTTEGQIEAACPDSGQPSGGANCQSFFARSVAGVDPVRNITYFQAQQALANSGKRLPTNAEWQQAVAGTPDSTACNVDLPSVANTGAHAACVSRFGANDMVGNLWEYVADWDEQAEASPCDRWSAEFGSDVTCLGNGSDALSTGFPGTLIRGGDFGGGFGGGTDAGPFAASTIDRPDLQDNITGFRGAR